MSGLIKAASGDDEISVTVVDVEREDSRQLTVLSSARSTVAEAVAEILALTGHPGPVLLAGRPLADGLWRSCGVRHGTVLHLGTAPPPGPPTALELLVVAGPSAGIVHRLRAGSTVLGRATGCDVVLADDEVSRQHAEITLSAGNATVRDLGSTNGLAVDGVLAPHGAVVLAPGAVLTVGESQLTVRPARDDPAALVNGEGLTLRFNRPPRVQQPPAVRSELVEPVEPAVPERSRIPLVTVLVPIALGAVLFLTMPSSPQYLLLMAMSPLMVIGNLVSDRTGGRRRHRVAVREHAAAVLVHQELVSTGRAQERLARLAAAPDPAELLSRASLPSSRLWERRTADADTLSLRIGLADLPSMVITRAATGLASEPPPEVSGVPLLVALNEVGVLGIAGAERPALALTRWLVGQACVLVAPGDLSVVLLTTASTVTEWEWLRWLPHAVGRSGASRLLVGTDDESCAQRVAELGRLVDARQAERRPGLAAHPRVLLVVDGARDLRRVPGLAALLAHGPDVGLFAVCRDEQERLLPQECSAVAVFEAGSSSRLTLRGPNLHTTTGVLADQVSQRWAEQVARGMCGLEDVSAATAASAGLPVAVRLLDLVGLPAPTSAAVVDRWQQNGRSTSAVVGVGPGGPLLVDLAADGPHALVAGTTGAGKSELLQTLVASLALANRPEALTFVLIDYKGGAAFRDCARLPHTVGLVTDLNGRLTERALASLSAELRHRERVLAQHGVKDLEALLGATSGPPPLARLVIVIDEFATLVEELPDFVRGLVGIAQRGRSLGIHLVLATQRPGGVVSPDIRANTNLRICLRVTQTNESSDVIDAPDAGEIAAGLPGRGFVRTGAGALLAFQAARVGGLTPAQSTTNSTVSVLSVPFADLGRPRDPIEIDAATSGPSDLQLLVDAISLADAELSRADAQSGLADASGLAGSKAGPVDVELGQRLRRRPWLDPLPDRLTLGDLPPSDHDLPLGLVDLPALQQQLPYGLQLADGGHLLVAGAARSGRSSVLQTLAGGVAEHWSAEDLHLYALDFGNQALAPLAELPHCGAVVSRDQPERLERLLCRLLNEVERRQGLLAAQGYADLAEQRRLAAPADRLPWLLLLVDRWEGLVQAYQDVDLGRRIEDLLRLLREGPSVGLRAVVTTDRSGLIGRLPSVVPDKLVLRLTDRADYALADIPGRDVPTSPPPGRGLVVGGGETRSLLEVQIALLSDDPAGSAQLAALRSLVSAARQRHSGRELLHRPLRVDPLPSTVSVGHALSLGPTAAEAAGLWALIGVGGDQLRPVGVDLAADGPGFLVAGAPRSGRSTALVTMAESLLRSGRAVCLVTSSRSPLHALAAHPGVTGCLDGSSSEDEARTAILSSDQRPVLVVDDAERLTDTVVGGLLEQELKAEPGAGAYVLAAGNSADLQNIYRGFTVDLRRSRCGLLLNPQSALDGDLLGARLPRHLNVSGQPGRALLVVRGELTMVQVAQVADVAQVAQG